MTVRVRLARLPDSVETERTLRGALQRAMTPLGGMKHFVRPGARVLIKADQSLPVPHDAGVTTSPRLVRVLIRACRDAGAREIWLADDSAHGQQTRTVMTQ